jgi:hypothetical protein
MSILLSKLSRRAREAEAALPAFNKRSLRIPGGAGIVHIALPVVWYRALRGVDPFAAAAGNVLELVLGTLGAHVPLTLMFKHRASVHAGAPFPRKREMKKFCFIAASIAAFATGASGETGPEIAMSADGSFRLFLRDYSRLPAGSVIANVDAFSVRGNEAWRYLVGRCAEGHGIVLFAPVAVWIQRPEDV